MKPSFQPFKVSFRHNPPPIRRIPLFKLGKRLSRASWTHGHKEPWSRPSSWVTWILEDLGPEDREELQNVLHLGGKMKTHAGCVCVHASMCGTLAQGVCVCNAQGVCVNTCPGVCVCVCVTPAQGVCAHASVTCGPAFLCARQLHQGPQSCSLLLCQYPRQLLTH